MKLTEKQIGKVNKLLVELMEDLNIQEPKDSDWVIDDEYYALVENIENLLELIKIRS